MRVGLLDHTPIQSIAKVADVIDLSVSSDTTNTLRLVLVSGGQQSATAGALLTSPIVLKAVNVQGVPVPGAEIAGFSSDGLLTPSVGTTDANGLFTTNWTLGATLGLQTAYFSFSGGPYTLTVSATAR